MIYYNEFDPKAAAWLWELIDMGMIGRGIVDDRSIIDVDYRDLYGFDQHHFFAGIGGWSYALRLAGWPDDIPVWTASLPCQPFSAAGKGLGKADERHLLPHFLELVKQCRPDIIFGEQVERAIAHGWLDDLQTTMEAENYAIGHCVLGAHSIGAAHIRQRLYWVANAQSERDGRAGREGYRTQGKIAVSRGYEDRESSKSFTRSAAHRVADSKIAARKRPKLRSDKELPGRDFDGRMAYNNKPGSQGRTQSGCSNKRIIGQDSLVDWIECRDGKLRPVEPGILPLANGVPRGMVHSRDPNASQEARKMRLHGYGNAIVPQVAAEFINAYCII